MVVWYLRVTIFQERNPPQLYWGRMCRWLKRREKYEVLS